MNTTACITRPYEVLPPRPRRGYKPNQTQFSISNGVYGSGHLRKLRHCIIKEPLVAFAEITFPALVAVKRNPIFYAAAATNGKVSANKTFVAKILLGPGKGAFFSAGGEFFYRRFKNIAQLPFRLYKKIAAETIAGMLDNNITAALFIESTNCMLAGDTIRQN